MPADAVGDAPTRAPSGAVAAPTAGRAIGPGGREVAFLRWGGGAAVPVLLLHGVTDSAECWTSVVRHIAHGRTVVAVDARGHGRTPLGDGPFTMAALAADAAAVLREIVGRPALVVGHSMGGLVAEELALAEPGLVAGLVLEEPAWDMDAGAAPGDVPPFLAAWLRMFAGVGQDELERRARGMNASWPDDEYSPWARSKTQVDQRLGRVSHDWHGRDWIAALADLAVPVTLLTGDPARGSILRPAQLARAAEALGAGLVHVSVARAGHGVRHEGLETYLGALDAALARADAAVA
jgi:lipase